MIPRVSQPEPLQFKVGKQFELVHTQMSEMSALESKEEMVGNPFGKLQGEEFEAKLAAALKQILRPNGDKRKAKVSAKELGYVLKIKAESTLYHKIETGKFSLVEFVTLTQHLVAVGINDTLNLILAPGTTIQKCDKAQTDGRIDDNFAKVTHYRSMAVQAFEDKQYEEAAQFDQIANELDKGFTAEIQARLGRI